MSSFYIHDGRNEIGPFNLETLKKQTLTRLTPIRQKDSNSWQPAEKLPELKDIVAPRKIRRPKDIVPVVIERVSDLKRRRPKTLYGSIFCIALITAISIYSAKPPAEKSVPVQTVAMLPELPFELNELPAGVAAKKEEVKEKPAVKEDAAKNARLRWNKLIAATNSNYGIGFLGGIKDLSVIVSNRTDYAIDEAVVKVTYIKAGGGIWKTKLFSLYGIAAHDTKEQSVPDVGRGKKVKVAIYKIVSKKMKFSYTEGQKIKNPEDPYFKD